MPSRGRLVPAGAARPLDVVVGGRCDQPPMRRPLAFDTVSGLPVPVDLLVYPDEGWRRLTAGRDPFAVRLAAEVVRVMPATT